MKVFLSPTGLHSRAMVRVANALTLYSPPSVSVVSDARRADLRILHLIDYPHTEEETRGDIAIIQYCLRSAARAPRLSDWVPLWQRSRLVWSYYDLRGLLRDDEDARSLLDPARPIRTLCTPLGVDPIFLRTPTLHLDPTSERDVVLTIGYVSGPPAEAIEDVWDAAYRCNLRPIHVGGLPPAGLTRYTRAPEGSVEGISDSALAALYGRSRYVAALRYVEGFECTAGEGMACGAIPLLFDQPTTRRWYGRLGVHVVFVPDGLHGEPLIDALVSRMSSPLNARTDAVSLVFNRGFVGHRFNWQFIAESFWSALLLDPEDSKQNS